MVSLQVEVLLLYDQTVVYGIPVSQVAWSIDFIVLREKNCLTYPTAVWESHGRPGDLSCHTKQLVSTKLWCQKQIADLLEGYFPYWVQKLNYSYRVCFKINKKKSYTASIFRISESNHFNCNDENLLLVTTFGTNWAKIDVFCFKITPQPIL